MFSGSPIKNLVICPSRSNLSSSSSNAFLFSRCMNGRECAQNPSTSDTAAPTRALPKSMAATRAVLDFENENISLVARHDIVAHEGVDHESFIPLVGIV